MIRAAAFLLALAGPAAAQSSAMEQALAACGGTQISLSAPDGTPPEMLDRASAVLNARLGGGVLLKYVSAEGGGLVVRLPASSVDLDGFSAALSRVDLGFYEVAETGLKMELEGRALYLVEPPVLTGADIADAQPMFDHGGRPALSFRFTPDAARLFGAFTEAHIGAPFAIVLDGAVLSAPVIREPIHGGNGMISGNFTVEDVTALAASLRGGQLPIDLTVQSAEEVPMDPQADHSICPQMGQ